MSYRIIDGGLCVEKNIEDVIDAKERAEDYLIGSDAERVIIVDEQNGNVAATGYAVKNVEWSEG